VEVASDIVAARERSRKSACVFVCGQITHF
jgi:hypothetical protein